MLKTGLSTTSPSNPYFYIADNGGVNENIKEYPQDNILDIDTGKVKITLGNDNNKPNFDFNDIVKWVVILGVVYTGYIFLSKHIQ